MFEYSKDPHRIESDSFRQIRELTDLSQWNEDEAQVVMRLVHTCGDPSVAEDVQFSANAVAQGMLAAKRQAALLCDVEMVKQGVTRRLQKGAVHCFLNDPRTPELALSTGETRSMAAVELWKPLLKDSVILIGNAPTALFRLLELIEQIELIEAGADKPALIIGMPVGFVGAQESKEALVEVSKRLNVPYMSLSGRRGGSALTASAWNACLRLAEGIRF